MSKKLKLQIVCCGAPAKWALDGVNHWKKRIFSLAEIELYFAKSRNVENTIIKRIADKYCIALTRKGKKYSSRDWADMLKNLSLSPGNITFVVGDAEGLSEKILSLCDRKISLGPITIQHDVALIVLLEQLYRALSINAGLPYHRGE